jgi:HD-GYP domain-containing protein (c-di-GMP phosphodiesterase class II)
MLHWRVFPESMFRGLRRILERRASFPFAFSFVYILTVAFLSITVFSCQSRIAVVALVLYLASSLIFFRQYLRTFDRIHSIVESIKAGRQGLPTTTDETKVLGRLGGLLDELLQGLATAHQDLETKHVETVKAIALAMEARDSYTQGHCLRVRYMTRRILDVVGVSAEYRRAAETAALLHDVGKIGIADALLLKTEKLTPEEYNRLMLHVKIGVEILGPISTFGEAVTFVKHHHERYDGTGYPDGLKGVDIPLASRIIAVADAIDAMRSSRPYRKGMSLDAAVGELRKASGAQFDPRIVEIAISLIVPSDNPAGTAVLSEKRAPAVVLA